MMKSTSKTFLLSTALAAFVLHVIASSRWLIIYFTRGNRKTIPVDLNEAVLFFGLVLVFAFLGWFSHTVRKQHIKLMAVATGLNIIACLFTGTLMLTGIIKIIRY